jgi:hypothetical protein
MSQASSQKPESNSNLKITVTVRAASKPSSIKAHADVQIEFSSSRLEIFGLSVVQHDPQKPAWVSYPQRAGKDGKKYFPVVRASGTLHDKICAAVLSEFERMPASGCSSEREKIPREAGSEDAVPF